jgi:hypothetical protein
LENKIVGKGDTFAEFAIWLSNREEVKQITPPQTSIARGKTATGVEMIVPVVAESKVHVIVSMEFGSNG